MTARRAIPSVPAGLSAPLRNFLSAVREAINNLRDSQSTVATQSPISKLVLPSTPGTVPIESAQDQSVETSLEQQAFWENIGDLISQADSIVYTGIVFSPNSPSTNKLSWTSGVATKKGAQIWSISAEATGVDWTSGDLYVYYVEGDSALRTTSEIIDVVTFGGHILAIYKGGTDITIGDARAFIDGSEIIDHTIDASLKIVQHTVGASELVNDQNIITEAVQIESALISTAHIGAGQISAMNIASAASFTPTSINETDNAETTYESILSMGIDTVDVDVSRVVFVAFSLENPMLLPGDFKIIIQSQENAGTWTTIIGGERIFDVGTKQVVGSSNFNTHSFTAIADTTASSTASLRCNLILRNGVANKWNNATPPIFSDIIMLCSTWKR